MKQLQVANQEGEEGETQIIPMLREYSLFNADQCDGLPDRVPTLGEVKARNADERDPRLTVFSVQRRQLPRGVRRSLLSAWR